MMCKKQPPFLVYEFYTHLMHSPISSDAFPCVQWTIRHLIVDSKKQAIMYVYEGIFIVFFILLSCYLLTFL